MTEPKTNEVNSICRAVQDAATIRLGLVSASNFFPW